MAKRHSKKAASAHHKKNAVTQKSSHTTSAGSCDSFKCLFTTRNLVITAIILVLLVAGFSLFGQKDRFASKSSANTLDNAMPSGSVESGDTVSVKYVGRFLNGSIFDTNDEAVAEKEGYMLSTSYLSAGMPLKWVCVTVSSSVTLTPLNRY